MRRHLLLLLPSLLAAMGTSPQPAHASDDVGGPSNLAVPSKARHFDPLSTLPEVVSGPLKNVSDPSDPPPSIASETPRHAIFDILAEARSQIGYLPTPAAPPGIVSTGTSHSDLQAKISVDTDHSPVAKTKSGNAPRPLVAEDPRRTIFEIMAETYGSSRFQPKKSSAAESLATKPSTEPLADTIPRPAKVAKSGTRRRPVATGTHSPTAVDLQAEELGKPHLRGKDTTPTASVTSDAPAPTLVQAGHPLQPTAGTDDPSPSVVGETSRRQTFDILADVLQGSERLMNRGSSACRPAVELASGALRAATPLHKDDTEIGQTTEHVTADAPRRKIFDILAETYGSSRFPLKKEAPPASSPAGDVQPTSAEDIALSPDNQIQAGRTPRPIAAGARGSAPYTTPTRHVGPAGDAARPALVAAAGVNSATLETLRGGFETSSGLRITFGIERAVLINGVLQSRTELHFDDLARALGRTGGPADALPAGATASIVQNGLHNVVHTALPATSLATVVQNSLDNQQLQTMTTITATVNSAEMLRGIRMQQSLQDSVNRAAMTH